ncbi:DUF6545 domain-containing protein [Mycobacteroides abscessus]
MHGPASRSLPENHRDPRRDPGAQALRSSRDAASGNPLRTSAKPRDNDVRAAATACWITSALHNRSQDHQTLADHEDQPQQSASLSTEAAHLSKVAFFYSSPLPTQFGAFLRQAQNVPHTNQNPSITQA